MGPRFFLGSILYGYCDGHFGRDSYDKKRVEAIGVDWVVVREIDSGQVLFASGARIHEKLVKASDRWEVRDDG